VLRWPADNEVVRNPRRRTSLRVWLSIALFVALAVAGAAAYVALAPKHYRATSEVLVTSVSDARYEDLPVLRGPGAVETAVQLEKTSTLAESVRQQLGLRESAAELLAHVHPHRAGSSTVMDVTATASTPSTAVKVANSFADLLVAEETAALNSAIIDQTTRTLEQLVRLPPTAKAGAQGTALRGRLATLRSLARSTNPSLRVLSHAAQAKTVRPPALPIVLGALLGALLLGGLAGLLAARRRRAGADAGSAYDQSVTDTLVAQLEQRLAGRIESLLAEQERLAAKEAELVARERALDETQVQVQAPPDPARAAELESRERTLEERVKVVTKRELELARRAGELTQREQELEARAEELAHSAEELETRAEELARRAEELEERTASATPPPPPEPLPVAPALANVSELPQRPGRWNLNELARIVEERGPDFPDRQDEWQSYLFFLRNYAEPDGTVPASFDWLIEETFAGIVPAAAS
jgi:capsular polysaccharide biosynthesis protein